MIVYLNGEFVPQENASVPILDRSFLYGDGLFETVRVRQGTPSFWHKHFNRLESGAAFLKIPLPYSCADLYSLMEQLLASNEIRDALLRIHLSRGTGPRGYSIHKVAGPFLVMSLHPAPPAPPAPWTLINAATPIQAANPLAPFKTANKLIQILARIEADHAGADEALLVNEQGVVAETSAANIFWVEGNHVCTPPPSTGLLPGITRETVLEICPSLNLSCVEKTVTPDELKARAGIFLTLSSFGIVEVKSLDGKQIPPSPIPTRIRKAYDEATEQTAGYTTRLRPVTFPLPEGEG